eukprot:826299-Amphidinium_carterae.1
MQPMCNAIKALSMGCKLHLINVYRKEGYHGYVSRALSHKWSTVAKGSPQQNVTPQRPGPE